MKVMNTFSAQARRENFQASSSSSSAMKLSGSDAHSSSSARVITRCTRTIAATNSPITPLVKNARTIASPSLSPAGGVWFTGLQRSRRYPCSAELFVTPLRNRMPEMSNFSMAADCESGFRTTRAKKNPRKGPRKGANSWGLCNHREPKNRGECKNSAPISAPSSPFLPRSRASPLQTAGLHHRQSPLHFGKGEVE